MAFITIKRQIDISILKEYCEDTLLPFKVPSVFYSARELASAASKESR